MITFENERFHLRNDFYSYVMEISRGKYLFHRYWGRPLKEFRDSAPLQAVDRGFSGQPADFENERTYSLDVLPQEYPMRGRTDFRIPAYAVELENGTNISELNYASYKILDEKPALKGLPASFGDSQTLVIELKDVCANFTVYLSYTVFADSPILARSARFVNTGGKKIKIRNAASAAIDFPDNDFDTINLYGGHAAERTIQRKKVSRGIFEISSTRGASSHQHSPFIALARPDATEFAGEVYSASLIYSGSFAIKVEAEQFGTTRLVIGLNPDVFSWTLEPGEHFQTPEVALNFSAHGFNALSQIYHNFFRQHLMRSFFKDKFRPILVNNWEATYFNFNARRKSSPRPCANARRRAFRRCRQSSATLQLLHLGRFVRKTCESLQCRLEMVQSHDVSCAYNVLRLKFQYCIRIRRYFSSRSPRFFYFIIPHMSSFIFFCNGN